MKEIDLHRMVTTYNNGAGLSEVARRFGICVATAKKYLIRAGVKIRDRGRPRSK